MPVNNQRYKKFTHVQKKAPNMSGKDHQEIRKVYTHFWDTGFTAKKLQLYIKSDTWVDKCSTVQSSVGLFSIAISWGKFLD